MEKNELYLLYIAASFSGKYQLPKARLIKMLYLADWKNCLVTGTQLSDTKWYFNHFGPYVIDLQKIIEHSNYFKIQSIMEYLSPKDYVSVANPVALGNEFNLLSDNEKTILNFVIDKTQHLGFNDFIRLVYSTYPVIKQDKYTYFDLPLLAKEYLEIKNHDQ